MSARAKHVYRYWDGSHYRQRTFDRKSDKDLFMAELRRRRQLGGVLQISADVTLAEFVEEWWELYVIPNLEDNTQASYLQQWGKYLLPRLGGYKLRAITPRVVHRFSAELLRAGVGEPTVRYALAVLQSIMSFAVAEERVAINAVAAVRKPSGSPSRQVDPIEPLVVEQMRARVGLRDATMIATLGYAGVRPQELLALGIDDVTDHELVIGKKNVDGEILPYTKTRKNRRVKLLGPLAQDLREWIMASGRRTGLLFPDDSGGPWSRSRWNNWRGRVYDDPRKKHLERGIYAKTARAVGLASSVPYDLRAAFVSLLVWEGHTMLEVAAQAGHSVQTCELHYARIFAGYDPGKRSTADVAIRKARDAVQRGPALFDTEVMA
jgi:integrase